MMLRDYQLRAADAVMTQWQDVQSTCVVHATGLGKTRLAAEIIERMRPKRALFMAHQRKLIHQAKAAIEKITGLQCDVEMGEERASNALWGKSPVVIASVQTQFAMEGRRLFDPNDFGLLIVDELHHYVGAPAFQGVVEHYKQNPDLKILGLTATPKRTDQQAIGQIFDSVADVYEIQPAIKDGWLVEIVQQFVPVDTLDYSHVRTTAGDLNGADLAAVMEAEQVEQGMILPILELSFGVPQYSLKGLPVSDWGNFLKANGKARRSIIFCTSIKQAETFANIINRAVEGTAAYICERTPEDERNHIYKSFAEGTTPLVSNVDILGEGYDNPAVEFIFMARPTKSLSKYTQFIGRGTRPLPGVVDGLGLADERRAAIAASAKPRVTIVDFVGNSGIHKLVSSFDILGGETSEEALERAVQRAKKQGGPVSIAGSIEEAEEDLRAEMEARKRDEEARKARLVAKSNYKTVTVNPFDVLDIKPAMARGWDEGKRLSEKQRAIIVKMGLNPDQLSYPQARQLIGEQFRRWEKKLCTFKQAAVLKKRGIDAKDMSMKEASAILDALARNGWRRGPQVEEVISAGQAARLQIIGKEKETVPF